MGRRVRSIMATSAMKYISTAATRRGVEGFVSRESNRIIFSGASFNGLKLAACDGWERDPMASP